MYISIFPYPPVAPSCLLILLQWNLMKFMKCCKFKKKLIHRRWNPDKESGLNPNMISSRLNSMVAFNLSRIMSFTNFHFAPIQCTLPWNVGSSPFSATEGEQVVNVHQFGCELLVVHIRWKVLPWNRINAVCITWTPVENVTYSISFD